MVSYSGSELEVSSEANPPTHMTALRAFGVVAHNGSCFLEIFGSVGKLVDPSDLSSDGQNWPCGFESRLSHFVNVLARFLQ